MAITIGIDIGGSHITAAVVDPVTHKIVPATYFRRRVDSSAAVASIIEDWTTTIRASINNYEGDVNLGFAMPGPFNYGEGICLIKAQGKYLSLYGLNIKNLLRDVFGPQLNLITFTNDALCFLIGEVKVQNDAQYQHILGLTLGTGLGSSYFDAGVFVDADLWNKPFLNGIAEDYFSTRWFTKTYFEHTGIEIKGVQEMLETSFDGDLIQNIFNEFGENLYQFIAMLAIERPMQQVILGGNIAKTFSFFKQQLAKLPFEISCSVLGEEAALIGAAMAEQKAISEQIDFLSVKSHHIG